MHSDPHNWDDWLAIVKGWLHGDIPLDSLLMTAAVAALRVFYTGRSWRRLLLEVPLCCLLAVAAFTIIKPVPVAWLSEDWRVGIGAAIGLIGVEHIRALSVIMTKKFAGKNDE
ncbi:TPA: phage holin, lambda family [Salmonella enterica subsp. enterica serovar Bareilly]|uniref:Phage holin, lambda family n=1 Tax=Salmonella enterica TaxID=28901 RepID=A0A5V2R0B6_SALER|nr:phage holin, lambda family [Salmonella enterica]ECE0790085.1 phage holin, lambda family [Salmonella enterica subsp. diarizonae]ECF0263826.1 phage holin, lambda family [Salmonella enterica subsp. enterica serovar Java]ECF1922353.1 phage holin, lambda family [Salmonella enterica subsp. enterica serovar Newport]ECK9472909.1 phage holin, lambda family [Salmonella enterica subsp. enterica serovar Dublin str. CFSAN000518]EEA8039559.1 phage holin, lambda family [Salmonella enterica subsp. enterica